MAEEDVDAKTEKPDAAKGASKKRLILLIVLGLVIVAISVGGTLAALHFLGGKPVPVEDAEPEEEVAPLPKPAIYYPIKPEIIVTYEARGRQRYMQASISLLVRDDDVVAAIELHMSMVRNTINMVLGSQTYEGVQTAEGKELMRQQCLQELQKNMEQEIGKPGIEQVLFTNLVLQ